MDIKWRGKCNGKPLLHSLSEGYEIQEIEEPAGRSVSTERHLSVGLERRQAPHCHLGGDNPPVSSLSIQQIDVSQVRPISKRDKHFSFVAFLFCFDINQFRVEKKR